MPDVVNLKNGGNFISRGTSSNVIANEIFCSKENSHWRSFPSKEDKRMLKNTVLKNKTKTTTILEFPCKDNSRLHLNSSKLFMDSNLRLG